MQLTTLPPNGTDDDYQLLKQQILKRKSQIQSNPQLTLSNRYESLKDYDISGRNNGVIVTKVSHLPPEKHASKKNVKTSYGRKQNNQKKAYDRDEYKQKKNKRNFLQH